MTIKRAVPAACIALAFSASHAAAITGFPIITTDPATISVTNFFGTGGRVLNVPFSPRASYTIAVSTTIASAVGAPGLVGQTLEFEYGVENGSFAGNSYSLDIAGFDILVDPLSRDDDLLVSPPLVSDTPTGGGNFIFEYAAPFEDLGPNIAAFPDLPWTFRIDQDLPTKTGYEQCNANDECEFSNLPLAEVNGLPVVASASYDYIEGQLANGTITFNPDRIAPVPLPGTALLLIGALGGLAAARRRA